MKDNKNKFKTLNIGDPVKIKLFWNRSYIGMNGMIISEPDLASRVRIILTDGQRKIISLNHLEKLNKTINQWYIKGIEEWYDGYTQMEVMWIEKKFEN